MALPITTLLSSTTVPAYEDSETVLITRAVQTGLNLATTTIYSGPGDFQADTGNEIYDPAGAVQTVDAVLVIDPLPNGSLPIVLAEDTVTVAGFTYSVVLVEPWNYPPAHLELRLKKGPQAYEGPK